MIHNLRVHVVPKAWTGGHHMAPASAAERVKLGPSWPKQIQPKFGFGASEVSV